MIEAPQLHRCGQAYCLFYSSNCYRTTNYNIGFAVARNITGPYTSSQQPLVQANTAYGAVLGPGNPFCRLMALLTGGGVVASCPLGCPVSAHRCMSGHGTALHQLPA